jgi:hypothetical protein
MGAAFAGFAVSSRATAFKAVSAAVCVRVFCIQIRDISGKHNLKHETLPGSPSL